MPNKHKKDHITSTTLREQNKKSIPSDVDGSYTGVTYDGDTPVQDVDDL